MRVYVVPADYTGSDYPRSPDPAVRPGSFYRAVCPSETINRTHPQHDVRIVTVDELPRAGVPDVVVFQRPLRRTLLAHMLHLKALGAAVVVDLDDRVDLVPMTNAGFVPTHPHRADFNCKWLTLACCVADWMTVTTHDIGRRYKGSGGYSVVENFVPEAYLDVIRCRNNIPTICWAGFTIFHPGDLEVIGDAVAKTVRQGNAHFLAFGDASIGRVLGLGPSEFVYQPPVSLKEYPRFLARADVSLIPLQLSAFNKAKSWLKAVQSAAVGTIPIMSDLPEQRRLSEQFGVGIVCATPERWRAVLSEIVTDPSRQAELGNLFKENVRKHLTMEQNCHRFLAAWRQALYARDRGQERLIRSVRKRLRPQRACGMANGA